MNWCNDLGSMLTVPRTEATSIVKQKTSKTVSQIPSSIHGFTTGLKIDAGNGVFFVLNF